MKARLRQAALGVALGYLVLGSVLGGKLWPWQGLLLALIGGVVLVLWAASALLPAPPAAPEATKQSRAKAKSEQAPAPAPWRPDAVDWALVAFLAWEALSWFGSVYRFATGLYLAKLLACAVVFWLFRYGLGQGRAWRAALWSLVLGGVLLAIIGLREYVRTVHFLGSMDWRVFGPMANPNAAAGYLLLTLFPAAALLLGSQSRSVGAPASSRQAVPSEAPATRTPEIGAAFALLLMLATLLLTGSKAALAALLVALVVFALVGFGGNRRLQAAIIGLAALTVVAALLLPPLRARLVGAFGWQSHSTVFRLYTWQATLNMIQARPLLGFGGGTFENALPRFAIAGYTRAAHQSYLQIAAETGVPGLLLALAWGVLLLHRLLRAARAGLPLARLTAAAAFAGVTASALQELFDYPWYMPAVACSFLALAGLGLSAGGPSRGPGHPGPASVAGRRPWAIAAAVCGLLLILWSGKNLIAETISARGDMAAAARDYAAASATYERAGRWNPAQARFPVQMSRSEEALAGGGDESALARALQARLRTIALQPTEPQNFLALARLYEMAKRTDDALAAAQQALALYPNYPRGMAELGRLQELAGRREDALATFRRLVALQDSPVGRYPPVEGVVETSYAVGWLALGDEAVRAGQAADALVAYSRATVVLEVSIRTELATREAAGGESTGLARLDEDSARAEEVLTRLRRIDSPLSLMRQAQLLLALRRGEEARPVLERLAAAGKPTDSKADALAARWGMLRLAKELQKDEPARSAALVDQSMKAPPVASAPGELPQHGWLAADSASLSQLQQWAETAGRPSS